MASASKRTIFRMVSFALCAVRHPRTGKWLCVNEKNSRGWWIAGGGVDGGESFGEAAKREVKEETLIDVDLVGVLKVEHDVMGEMGRMRVIFLGKPADPEQMPKSEPDSESMGAAYLTLDEMRKYEALGQLRGREPLEWAEFIEAGGKASPLSILGPETGTKRPLDEDPLVSVEVDEAAVGSADSSA